MADFSLTEEQDLLRRSAAEFAEREILPRAQAWDEEDRYPVELLKKMGELGYLGVKFPQSLGGSGLGNLGAALLFEELARASAGIALGAYCHEVLALTPLALFGTEEQKQKFLVPGIRGQNLGAFGMAEAEAGSDLGAIRTRAIRRDGGYVLDGSKLFTTNGTFADFAVVSAVTAPERGLKGISLFVVERDAPGFSVSRRIKMVGMHPAETAELTFEECHVPEENRLGEEHLGFYNAMKSLTEGRIVAAAFAVGIARAAFEAALAHARQRVQFGQPIARFQAVGFTLADMATQIDAARLLAHRAAWLADRGAPHIAEASMAKLFASEVATRVCERALHIHGAYGYAMESPVQRFYRDCKVLEIGEGTSEMHRSTILKALLEAR